MTTTKSKKVTLTKLKDAERPTQPSISQSQKKVAHRSRASAASTPASSAPALSRCMSVKDIEDDEPTSVGPTLDVNGDSIMELSDSEGGGTQENSVKDMSELSDDKDMLVDDEEVELSMLLDLEN